MTVHHWLVTSPLPSAASPASSAFAADGFHESAALVRYPQPYVLLASAASDFFGPVPRAVEDRLEEIRCNLARIEGISPSPTIPKLGLVASGDGTRADLRFRTRVAAGGPDGAGWHPGAPGSGLLAVAAAAFQGVALVRQLLPRSSTSMLTFETPAGLRTVELETWSVGTQGLRIHVEVEIEDDRL